MALSVKYTCMISPFTSHFSYSFRFSLSAISFFTKKMIHLRKVPKYIATLSLLLPVPLLLIFLSTVVSSHSPTLHKTQHLTSSGNTTELLVATLNQTISKVNFSSSNFSDLQTSLGSNLTHRDRCAFGDCLELLDDTVLDLTAAISELQSPYPVFNSVSMLLSAAMTNTRTCLDGFASSDDDEDENTYGSSKTYGLTESMRESLYNISRHVRESLAMLENIPGKLENDVGFPTWVDRKLLQDPTDETKIDLVVSRNGTGNFTTIGEAVSAAPNLSETRYENVTC